MILNKPKFWDKKIGFISLILIPFSLLFLAIIYLKKKFTKIRSFKTPIICVGNIYIGGTGKTPTSIFLAQKISELGKNTTILRSFHNSHEDEYNLIKNNFKNLIVNKNRIEGIKEAERLNYDTVILDDGLQDYRINKNLSIVCFNLNQQIGNGLVLPSGPLRESLGALKNADIIILNGNKNKNFEEKILSINNKLKIFYSTYKPVNIDKFKDKKLLAIAGIGNPENFFQLLEKYNLNVEKKLMFPDHYKFSKNEIENIVTESSKSGHQIIMTEKDYFKIMDYKIDKIDYLKVSIEISNLEKLLSIIKRLYD